jgi:hypothetical protein
MEILLRWVGAQLVGLALTGALLVRDLVHGPAIDVGQADVVTRFLASYSEKFAGLGISLCVFVLNDLVFRATDARTNQQCVGPAIRLPAFCSLFLLIVYAVVYGIALMTIPFAMANLFAGYPFFFYGFMILLLATLVLSLTYVIRLEIIVLHH